MKKPAVALIAAGFLLSAAFAATFMVLDHPQLAEVDEPVYLDYAPLAFEDGFQDEGDFVVCGPAPCSGTAAVCPPLRDSATGVGRSSVSPGSALRTKVSVSRPLTDFCSCSKAVQAKPLPAFSSIAVNPVAIAVR